MDSLDNLLLLLAVLCLTGPEVGDSHLVNPSLCLLVLFFLVIKF